MYKECPICKNKKNSKERELNKIDLLKCSSCNFVYANISQKEIEAVNSGYNDEVALKYEKQRSFADEYWFKKIALKFTKKIGPGKVLDIGCGNGLLLKYFAEYGWDCFGVDLSPWSKKYAELYKFKLMQGKIEDLDLPKNYFDLVVSTSTLEHIAFPVLFIERIIQFLKPNGIGYFTGMPNYNSISILLNLSNFQANCPPNHVNYFTTETLKNLFSHFNNSIEKLSIKTYGIPEIYQLYEAINHKIYNKNKLVTDEKARNKNISKIATSIYYYSGRLFSLGGKIEVIIIKK